MWSLPTRRRKGIPAEAERHAHRTGVAIAEDPCPSGNVRLSVVVTVGVVHRGVDLGRPASSTTLNLTFPTTRVFSDCDPGSVGVAFASAGMPFPPSSGQGHIYTSIQKCNKTCSNAPTVTCTGNENCPGAPASSPLDPASTVRLGLSTPRTLTRRANAVVTVPRPTSAGDCLFVGSSTIINGTESAAVTGFASVGGAGAASPVAQNVRAQRLAGSLQIRWNTQVEIGLAGFNVLAEGSKREARKVNDLLIAAAGNGGGKSYMVSIHAPSFGNSRTIIIESVLTDGTTLKSAPGEILTKGREAFMKKIYEKPAIIHTEKIEPDGELQQIE